MKPGLKAIHSDTSSYYVMMECFMQLWHLEFIVINMRNKYIGIAYLFFIYKFN